MAETPTFGPENSQFIAKVIERRQVTKTLKSVVDVINHIRKSQPSLPNDMAFDYQLLIENDKPTEVSLVVHHRPDIKSYAIEIRDLGQTFEINLGEVGYYATTSSFYDDKHYVNQEEAQECFKLVTHLKELTPFAIRSIFVS